MKTVSLIAIVMLTMVWCSGCNESQVKWGKGDPPQAYQDIFGNGPGARLNFVQNKMIDQQIGIIVGIDEKQPDGTMKRTRGLVGRITALELLNAEQHKKIGVTQIRSIERITALEDRVSTGMDAFAESLGGKWVKAEEPKPYIYEDPIPQKSNDANNIFITTPLGWSSTVCTKHGRLDSWGGTVTFQGSDKRYCYRCVWEITTMYLDKHIGVDPNTP